MLHISCLLACDKNKPRPSPPFCIQLSGTKPVCWAELKLLFCGDVNVQMMACRRLFIHSLMADHSSFLFSPFAVLFNCLFYWSRNKSTGKFGSYYWMHKHTKSSYPNIFPQYHLMALKKNNNSVFYHELHIGTVLVISHETFPFFLVSTGISLLFWSEAGDVTYLLYHPPIRTEQQNLLRIRIWWLSHCLVAVSHMQSKAIHTVLMKQITWDFDC